MVQRHAAGGGVHEPESRQAGDGIAARRPVPFVKRVPQDEDSHAADGREEDHEGRGPQANQLVSAWRNIRPDGARSATIGRHGA